MKQTLFVVIALTILSACTFPTSAADNHPPTESLVPLVESFEEVDEPTAVPSGTSTVAPSIAPLPSVESSPTPTPAPPAGSINPLTGLPVDDPSLLGLAPALISISNFPVSVRPQPGLSFAPLVIETTIGEGMTRFLALFYGEFPTGDSVNQNLGSVRSGRLYYEQIRQMFDAFIVMAGASPEVAKQLNVTFFREKVNFAGIQELAEHRAKVKGPPELPEMIFDAGVPEGGLDASTVEIFWSNLNRVRWTYDSSTGLYKREQDNADGSGKFYPAADKLTGEQLGFENVVVMAAQHTWETPTRIAIDLIFVQKEPAVFFRDGKAYKVYWSSLAPLGPFKFFNEDGTPFAYKPGQTWLEVISDISQIKEKSPGYWYVRFFNPY